jgi:hypothetical protein
VCSNLALKVDRRLFVDARDLGQLGDVGGREHRTIGERKQVETVSIHSPRGSQTRRRRGVDTVPRRRLIRTGSARGRASIAVVLQRALLLQRSGWGLAPPTVTTWLHFAGWRDKPQFGDGQ